MNTYHFLLIPHNGKTVRVFGELEDAEFNQYVTLARVDKYSECREEAKRNGLNKEL